MKHFLLFVICFSYLSVGFSQSKSSIDFVIRNFGINVDGHFNTFNIETDFNAKGELIGVKSKIKVASIETGIESRDEHLLNADYFDDENHEYIILKSKTISKKSDTVYELVSNITIKGKTKEKRIKVNCNKINSQYKITANFEINRRDFNVGGGSLVMSNTVKIDVNYYHNL